MLFCYFVFRKHPINSVNASSKVAVLIKTVSVELKKKKYAHRIIWGNKLINDDFKI